MVLFEEFCLRSGLPASSLGSISHAALLQWLVEQFPGADVGHWHEEVATGKPNQPLDIPLLVRTPHQTEVLLKQVVTLES